ncbi:hypothetical protein FA375_03535 [Pseudomonas aeruginosa]|nr:hypothetical protein [Pseudomonas aeruginosa]MCO2255522.1 hypothetical protein [Pseudomonas aeruginosa]MCO3075620.1 hypothetical protein [Pseudomonas aeruginosa]
MDAKNLAVLMQLKKAMEEANPQAIPTPFDSTPEKPQKTGWIVKNCRFCKTTKFRYRAEWVNPPVMCEGCRNERKTRYKPGKGDTLYAETKVFHGGGPGTGRRK